MGFQVQKKQCETCIYLPDSPLDLEALECAVMDHRGDFTTFRQCHHSKSACCRGFWDRHKNDFALGQVAQRMRQVEFVEHDEDGVEDLE